MSSRINGVSGPAPLSSSELACRPPLTSIPTLIALEALTPRLQEPSKFNSRQPLKIRHYHSDDGKFVQQCIEEYSSFIDRYPNDTSALIKRVDLYLKIQDWPSAMKDVERILKIDRNHAEALSFKAYIYLFQKEHLKAKICFNLALKLGPEIPLTLINLSTIYASEGDLLSAQKFLTDGLKLTNRLLETRNGDPELIWIRAEIHNKLGNLKEAWVDCVAYLNNSPGCQSAIRLLALLLFKMNLTINALQQYLILTKHSNNWSDFYNLGRTYKALLMVDETLANFKEALRLNPDNKIVLFEIALACIESNHPDAEEYVDLFKQRHRDSREILLLAGARIEEKQLESKRPGKDAIKYYLNYLNGTPAPVFLSFAYQLSGEYHSARKKFNLAILDFDKCVGFDPYNYRALYFRGVAWEKLTCPDLKLNIIKGSPEYQCNEHAISNFGYCLTYVDEDSLISQTEPTDPNINTQVIFKTIAHVALARARQNPELLESCLNLMGALVKKFPQAANDCEVLHCLAHLSKLNSNYTGAAQIYLLSSQLNPKATYPLVSAYEIYMRQEDFANAKLIASKLCELEPSNQDYKAFRKEVDKATLAQVRAKTSYTQKEKPPKSKRPQAHVKSQNFEYPRADPPKIEVEPISQESLDREARIRADVAKAEENRAAEAAQEAARRKSRSLPRQLQEARIRESKAKTPLSFNPTKTPALPPQETPSAIKAETPNESAAIPSPKMVAEPEIPFSLFQHNVAPMPVEIFKAAHSSTPQVTPKAFDPSLFVPGEFLKREKEVQEEVRAKPQIEPLRSIKANQIAFMPDSSFKRIQTAFGAIQRVELLISNHEDTLFNKVVKGLALLEELRLLMDALSTSEKSSFGEDKDFEGMANQVLVSTKAVNRLKKDISTFYPFIQHLELEEFSRQLLASDLKQRLEALLSKEGAWHPHFGEGVTLLNDLELVTVDVKLSAKNIARDALFYTLVNSQLSFLVDLEKFYTPTFQKLANDQILRSALKTSLRILKYSMKWINDPKFEGLKNALAQPRTFEMQLAFIKSASYYLQEIASQNQI